MLSTPKTMRHTIGNTMKAFATSSTEPINTIDQICQSSLRLSRTLQLGHLMHVQRLICQARHGMKRCPQTGQHLECRDVLMPPNRQVCFTIDA